MDESHRKVVHYAAVASLVVIAFGAQTLGSNCYHRIVLRRRGPAPSVAGPPKAWRSLDYRLISSALVAFLVGILKQIGDALSWQWLPWCGLYHGGCHFEWLDLFLTVDGILTGLLVIIALHVVLNQCYRRRPAPARDLPCDPTEATTVDGDHRDGDGLHHCDSDLCVDLDRDLDCDGCDACGSGAEFRDEEAWEDAPECSLEATAPPLSCVLAAREDDAPSLARSAAESSAADRNGRSGVLTVLSSSPPLHSRTGLLLPADVLVI